MLRAVLVPFVARGSARQPRFGQAITQTVLLLAFVLWWQFELPILAALLAGGVPSSAPPPTSTRGRIAG